ncbi:MULTISPECIES: ATP-binding cassette domain-containing protein [Staphylococcus]|uniref:ATP-binding cassette domain-containing protein n=1 Tax=Staphylococcus TaxID=1279 RepID=UPI0015E06389|nr:MULTISPECIES: ABC transporter ATP-binding protein [Staphylococcus]MEB5784497.1 ABC transporter ATP-binding protein [Staphylococcus pseudoxylosus]
MNDNTGIQLHSVSKYYSDFQLKNIDLHIPMGKIGFLLGHNGAGKTTILKILSKNISVDNGTVSNISNSDLGMLFDENYLPEKLSIKEYEKVLPSLFNIWDKNSFDYYINKFKLPLKKPISTFSRGMKIKFNICVLLSYCPRFLLLDETTSGLDPLIREEVLLVIKDYINNNNATAILTTHILDDVLSISDYVFIIDNGVMKLNKPVSEFTSTEEIKEKIRSVIYKE